jgi:hypothetical protein
VDGKEFSQELRVLSDPNLPVSNDMTGGVEEYELWLGDEEPSEREEEEREEEECESRDPSKID